MILTATCRLAGTFFGGVCFAIKLRKLDPDADKYIEPKTRTM